MKGLPPPLQGLLAPRAYPHAVQGVELIETHISWVLLTGQWAYKIKRPVCYPFVDLRAAEHRAFLCHEELRLNRRFAAELYIEVCPITESDGEVSMAGAGTVIEQAVKMRQFDRAAVLDQLLDRAEVDAGALEEFGAHLAGIHAGLPACGEEWGQPASVRAQLLDNLDQCATAAAVFGDRQAVSALRAPLAARLEQVHPWMRQRGQQGRVRECHGDLHSANIVRHHGQLLAFDCLEFEPALRWIDVAQDVATLLADLGSRAQRALAMAFLCGYLRHSGDFQLCRLLDVYQAHRALVRAKVMALNALNQIEEGADTLALQQRYRTHLGYARECLAERHPALVLMHGLSGSGKSWLAHRLTRTLGAVPLSSDVERRRRAEVSAAARYSAPARAQVYRHLAEGATDTLAGGFTTLIDATFGAREQRAQFQALAAELAVPVCLVHCQAPPQVLRERVAQRLGQRHEASEADLQVLAWQQRHLHTVAPDEGFTVFTVNTADPESLASLDRSLGAFIRRSRPEGPGPAIP